MSEDSEILTGADAILAEMGDDSPARLPNGYACAQSFDAICQKESIKPDAMSASFTILTYDSKLNRHGNKVQIVGDESGNGRGMLLENYQRNPVVLFDHGLSGLSLPIGVSEDSKRQFTVKAYQGRMDAEAYFSQRLAEAVQIFALIDEGILRTASVQFSPLLATRLKLKKPVEKTSDGREVYDIANWNARGLLFIEAELLEWSVVSIPADPGAVRKCLDRGVVGTEKITQRLKPTLQRMAEPDIKVWSPGFTIPQNVGQEFVTSMQSVASELKALNEKFTAAFAADFAKQSEVTAPQLQGVADTVATPPVVETPGFTIADLEAVVKQAMQPVVAGQAAVEEQYFAATGKRMTLATH